MLMDSVAFYYSVGPLSQFPSYAKNRRNNNSLVVGVERGGSG
jgi:hypothetical protein